MYGINILAVAKILGTTTLGNILFSQNGVLLSFHQEIEKYAAQKNIAMIKVLMRNLAQQNDEAYKDVLDLLQEHFTEEELENILSS